MSTVMLALAGMAWALGDWIVANENRRADTEGGR
jgi:hypothetical protein